MELGTTPVPLDIASKTIPRIVGYLLHWGLFGILSSQVYIYHIAFPSDPGRNKFFVYSIYTLDIIQTTVITASAIHVFGVGYGNLLFYDQVELAWFSVPLITGLVAFLAGLFYAYRISILAESYWVPSVIVLLSIIQLAGAIVQAVETKRAVLFSKLLGTHLSISTGFWNGGSALCDVIIAVCMTFYLSRRGSQLGMPSTQRLLRRVVTLIIGSGIVTASVAVVNLVLIAFPGHPAYFHLSSDILAKVYSNSMMILLNRRIELPSQIEVNAAAPTFSLFLRDVRDVRGNESEIGMTSFTHGEPVTGPQHSIVVQYDDHGDEGRDMRASDKVSAV